nr:hypothetical protein [uncultured Rhodopila sp.]
MRLDPDDDPTASEILNAALQLLMCVLIAAGVIYLALFVANWMSGQ